MVVLGVINELEAGHQFVSSAKYFAALRRLSRSSRRRAFSRSSWRIRSASVTDDEASEVGEKPETVVRAPVPYFLTQICKVLQLMPRSAAKALIDTPGEFS